MNKTKRDFKDKILRVLEELKLYGVPEHSALYQYVIETSQTAANLMRVKLSE